MEFSCIFRGQYWGLAWKQQEKIHGRNANWKAQWTKVHNLFRKISHFSLTFRAQKKNNKKPRSKNCFPNNIFMNFWTFSIYRVDFQWGSRELNNPLLSHPFFKVYKPLKQFYAQYFHEFLNIIHLQFGLSMRF